MLLLIAFQQVHAQHPPSVFTQKITIEAQNESIRTILKRIEKQTGKSFSYDSKLVDPQKKQTVSFKEKTIPEIISLLFDNTVNCKIRGNYIVLYKNAAGPARPYSQKPGRSIKRVIPADSHALLKPSKTRNDTTVRYYIDIIVPTASGKDSVIRTESIEVPTTHVLQIKDDTTIILLKKDTVAPK